MRRRQKTTRMRTSIKRLNSEHYKGVPVHFVKVNVNIDKKRANKVGAVTRYKGRKIKAIANSKPSAFKKLKRSMK